MSITKRCYRCGLEKPISEFSADKSRRDGLQAKCRACDLRYHRQWHEQHADQKREYDRHYQKAHPEKRRESSRRYNKAHPDKNRESVHRYQKAHPDRKWARERTRRARKYNAPGSYTVADTQNQYSQQSGSCFWCSEPLIASYHIDHVIPLTRGGTNWPCNLVCACPRCNSSKGNRFPWLEWEPPNPIQHWHSALDDFKGNQV